MVDFNKLLGKGKQEKIIDPIEIFNNLDKDPDKTYLWPGQSFILDSWNQSHRTQKDTIVKLHTGQGKTLIGLLILQSLLNEGKGPALYLCPDKTLVKQTKSQADSFGIKYTEIIPETTGLPREFSNSDAILITTCQKLFNGKSVFGVEGGGREKVDVGSIVLDDAHKCLEIIRDSFSIRAYKKKVIDGEIIENPIYKHLFQIFSENLKRQASGTYREIIAEHDEVSIAVPFWVWKEKISDVLTVLDSHRDHDDVKYSWNLIKNNLEYCSCIFSGRRIEIVPRLFPINLIPSFSKAERRIFLSATLTEDAFLIKDLDLHPDRVANPLIYDQFKYSGERLIILPTLVDPSLKREELITWLSELPKKYGTFGFFVIVPSKYHARDWKNGIIVEGEHLESLIGSLKDEIKSKKAFKFYILVNKYDGIDLPSSTCRILCLDSLPSYNSLIDRYQQTTRSNSTIIKRKLAQRVEQGIGRALRGLSDYCIVIIIGNDISAFFSENAKRQYLSNEARCQISIGETLAAELRHEGSALNAIEGLIANIISRDQSWKDYYKEQMSGVAIKPFNTAFINQAVLERKAEICYQKGQFRKAIEFIDQLISESGGDMNEVGWYLQLKATYEYTTSKTKSFETQLSAFGKNPNLFRPPDGVQYTKLFRADIDRVNRIFSYTKGKESYSALILDVENKLDLASFDKSSDAFENGIDSLGELLGFETDRPEKRSGCGPDNLWRLNSVHYWVIECKNEVKTTRGVSKDEAGQINTSIGWFEHTFEGNEYTPVLIHPSSFFMDEAFSAKPLFSLQPANLESLKHCVVDFYKSLSSAPLSDVTEDILRRKIQEYHLAIEDLNSRYLKKVTRAKES